jgi:hypothetical protein
VPKRLSRRLVIDASVARSATMSQDETSTACREFLQAVLDVCHRAVLTADVYREWDYNALRIRTKSDERRTRFLVDWMFAMSRKKRGKILRARVDRDEALRAKINRLGLPGNARHEITEDLHLVEAAPASDRIVVSRDDSVRDLLRGIAGGCPEFAKVLWCNPVELGEEGVEWLRTGARVVKAWQLGSKRP